MKKIFLIILFFPVFAFSQKKDYKTYDKAISYFNNGEIEKAKKSINKCIQKNEDWEKPYQLLGKIYELEGDVELAIENYYKGFDSDNPKDQLWWQKLGDLYFENAMYQEALFHYESFVAFSDKDGAFYKKAIKHIQDCMFAIKAMQNPVKFNPENMGESINSEMAEYLPFISADGGHSALPFIRGLKHRATRARITLSRRPRFCSRKRGCDSPSARKPLGLR